MSKKRKIPKIKTNDILARTAHDFVAGNLSGEPKPILQVTDGLGKAITNIFTEQISSFAVPPKVGDIISVCDKARFLATQAEQTRANEAATREQAFLDGLFPDRSQYVNHGDGTYTICGLRWKYTVIASDFLYVLINHPDNTYRTTRIFPPYGPSTGIRTLTQFGAVLLRRDAHVEYIDTTYPKTFWGRFLIWYNYHFL